MVTKCNCNLTACAECNTDTHRHEPPPDDEDALDARDTRIATLLKEHLDAQNLDAWNLEIEIKTIKAHVAWVEQAVKAEQWWKLSGVLSEADIESLSNVSPSGLLDEDLDTSY